MMYRTRARRAAPLLLAAGLAACGGSLGNAGLPATPTVPQPPVGTTQTGGGAPPIAPQEAMRKQSAAYDPATTALTFPGVSGFGATLALGDVLPTPAPAVSSATPALVSPNVRGRRAARPSAPPTAPASLPPTPGPASPAPTGSPAAPAASPAHGRGAHPAASPTPSGPQTQLRLTAYPLGAPPAPQPADGKVPTRPPLLRAEVLPDRDLRIPGLAAFAFTLPASEAVAGRSYTIGLFALAKHKAGAALAADAYATAGADGTLRAAGGKPIVLRGAGDYLAVVYASPLAPTPAPVLPSGPSAAGPSSGGALPVGTSPLPAGAAGPSSVNGFPAGTAQPGNAPIGTGTTSFPGAPGR